MLKIDDNYLASLKKAFLEIGFSEDEAERQLADLAEVIVKSILERLISENPLKRDQIMTDVEIFIKNNYGGDHFENLIREIVERVVGNYLEEVTKNLEISKRQQFMGHLEQASQLTVLANGT